MAQQTRFLDVPDKHIFRVIRVLLLGWGIFSPPNLKLSEVACLMRYDSCKINMLGSLYKHRFLPGMTGSRLV